jgi:hypothetical protein
MWCAMSFMSALKYYAAVPLRVAAALTPLITGSLPLALLERICRFTEHPADILSYLDAVSMVEGFGKTESYYYDAMLRYKDELFLEALGHRYLSKNDFDGVKRLITEARPLFLGSPELLFLELTVAVKEMNEPQIERLSEDIIATGSASVEASCLAYNCKCWGLLTGRNYDAARSMADKILQVGESTVARVVLGTTEHIAGNELAAAQHYAHAAETRDIFPVEPLMAEASYIRGDMKAAANYLHETRRKGIPINDKDEAVLAIMASAEYREL